MGFNEKEISQIIHSIHAAGYSHNEIQNLCSDPRTLAGIKMVLQGKAEIVITENQVFDCDPIPPTPKWWSIGSHIPIGKIQWDPSRVALLPHKHTVGKDYISEPSTWQREYKDYTLLNAPALNCLLQLPQLIPHDIEWKKRPVSFIGTIYNKDNIPHVQSLQWDGFTWVQSMDFIGGDFWYSYGCSIPVIR